jgi:hypothetical protein
MGFVSDWTGQRHTHQLQELEAALNDRPDTGKLRRKLLNLGPLVDSRDGMIRRDGSLLRW